MASKESEEYINDLEEKIVDLSLRLKSKTNELNSVYQTNKELLSKLTHNLKNPIGVIFSFSEMILGDVENYSSEKLEKHLQIIRNSAEFSIQLLNEINKLSRLQSPNIVFSLKVRNYSELLNKLVNQFKAIASKKNITIIKDFPSTDVFFKFDDIEITQAINNIVNNALRYSKENTTITITITENENIVETVITDEGIGISEEDLPNVLNNFFVVNTYSEDKQKCIGLGLSIANKIIQLHKGKISVASILNKGTSFKIILPKK